MNIGQLRRFLPYSADERVTGSNVTLDDADHSRPGVGDLASEPQRGCETKYERPEADALNGPGYLDRQARRLAHEGQSAPRSGSEAILLLGSSTPGCILCLNRRS